MLYVGVHDKNSSPALTYGREVARLRVAEGYTQETFAPLIGLKVGSMGSLETGRRLPPRRRHDAIVSALGLGEREAKRLYDLWVAAQEEPAVEAVTFTTIDKKLDVLIGLVRDLHSSKPGRHRSEADGTPSAMPRPSLKGRRC